MFVSTTKCVELIKDMNSDLCQSLHNLSFVLSNTWCSAGYVVLQGLEAAVVYLTSWDVTRTPESKASSHHKIELDLSLSPPLQISNATLSFMWIVKKSLGRNFKGPTKADKIIYTRVDRGQGYWGFFVTF